jgi:hypothetical protein
MVTYLLPVNDDPGRAYWETSAFLEEARKVDLT